MIYIILNQISTEKAILMKEAMMYEKLENETVRCILCNHYCTIKDSKRGICGVRENKKGTLYTLTYRRLISRAVDPIEKKPLFHFYPGSTAYSIATAGCNFQCKHCQNADISQIPREQKLDQISGQDISPEKIVADAKRNRCKSIAYTYTEPTIFFEYVYDIAKLAKKEEIKNIFVTNGYISKEALHEIAPYLDAANIDLKAMTDSFYKEICGAKLQPVLDSIKLHKELGIWIELTTLIIPDLNDSDEELREIAQFIRNEVGEETPWHVSAFRPAYKLTDKPPTPASTLERAQKIGQEEGLKYVYLGNVGKGENTHCYNCGELLIQRWGFHVAKNEIKNGFCYKCNAKIDGVGL
jgi:pyruvate formate lyase activating enzyme